MSRDSDFVLQLPNGAELGLTNPFTQEIKNQPNNDPCLIQAAPQHGRPWEPLQDLQCVLIMGQGRHPLLLLLLLCNKGPQRTAVSSGAGLRGRAERGTEAALTSAL